LCVHCFKIYKSVRIIPITTVPSNTNAAMIIESSAIPLVL